MRDSNCWPACLGASLHGDDASAQGDSAKGSGSGSKESADSGGRGGDSSPNSVCEAQPGDGSLFVALRNGLGGGRSGGSLLCSSSESSGLLLAVGGFSGFCARNGFGLDSQSSSARAPDTPGRDPRGLVRSRGDARGSRRAAWADGSDKSWAERADARGLPARSVSARLSSPTAAPHGLAARWLAAGRAGLSWACATAAAQPPVEKPPFDRAGGGSGGLPADRPGLSWACATAAAQPPVAKPPLERASGLCCGGGGGTADGAAAVSPACATAAAHPRCGMAFGRAACSARLTAAAICAEATLVGKRELRCGERDRGRAGWRKSRVGKGHERCSRPGWFPRDDGTAGGGACRRLGGLSPNLSGSGGGASRKSVR